MATARRFSSCNESVSLGFGEKKNKLQKVGFNKIEKEESQKILENNIDKKLNSNNTQIGKNVVLPRNKKYSIFYIDTQKELPFDEFLIIGDIVYFNRDLYDDIGEAIEERIVKKMYRIKDDTGGGNQDERQFSLYDIDGERKVADVNINSSFFENRGNTNERIYEWKINWIDKSQSEVYKTFEYTSKN